MIHQLKKALSVSALGLTFMVFGANQGCDINIQGNDPYWLYEDDGDSGKEDDDGDKRESEEMEEDQILISGSGEVLNIQSGNLVFPARINWKDGKYFFAVDPEGKITGDRIICAASIDEDFFRGDCFRTGRVCYFQYSSDIWKDGGEDAYSLDFTTCMNAEPIGPFLVPLDSPLCGQDPFPACPSDENLFPTGPSGVGAEVEAEVGAKDAAPDEEEVSEEGDSINADNDTELNEEEVRTETGSIDVHTAN